MKNLELASAGILIRVVSPPFFFALVKPVKSLRMITRIGSTPSHSDTRFFSALRFFFLALAHTLHGQR
jgi:hypothetical protein